MATQFGILEADISPARVPTVEDRALLACAASGGADVTITSLIDEGEAEILARLGGMFTAAANIALGKPMAILAVIFCLHRRRTQNPDYQIPKTVSDDFDRAIRWAEGVGARLLAAEGVTQPAGSGNVEYTAPDATHTMTNLDTL